MNIIRIEKKLQNQTDQVELIISILCFLNGIHLSKTEQKALSFFVVYGMSDKTDQLLVKSNLLPNTGSIRNLKTKLHKFGFLKRIPGVYKSYEVNLSDDFKMDDNVISLVIKTDRG